MHSIRWAACEAFGIMMRKRHSIPDLAEDTSEGPSDGDN